MKSSELKSFIYGTMLGDSSISKNTISCGQIKKDLIEYKKKVYETHLPNVRITLRVENNSDSKHIRQPLYRLRATHVYFNKIRKRFYINGVKRVDKKILNSLKPNGLAVWFADDGTLS